MLRSRSPRELEPLEARPLTALDQPVIPLGVLRGRPAFAALLPEDFAPPEGAACYSLRALHARCSEATFEAATLAAQLVYFAKHYRFCARCAGALQPASRSRARVCARCGHEWYPRVSPCAIVLVHDGERLLMTRQARYPKGMYGLVAGFVEASESLEACARRECLEECSITVGALRYFGSQPWPFPHQLMVGFIGEYAGGALVVDHDELEDARWFHRDELPTLPPSISIARKMIDAWLRGET